MKISDLPLLKINMVSETVGLLQRALNTWLVTAGVGDSPLSADNDFGAGTQCYVMAFQTLHTDISGTTLEADGIVGSDTWRALAVYTDEIEPEAGIASITIKPLTENTAAVANLPEDMNGVTDLALKTLQISMGQVGVKEEGPGPNEGVQVELYQTGARAINPVPGSPWCASFVSWCVLNAIDNVIEDMPFAYSASSRSIERSFKEAGRFQDVNCVADFERMRPGSVLVWFRCGKGLDALGHIGFVHHYDAVNRRLHTIEGNRNNRVYAGDYALKDDLPQRLIRGLIGFGELL